MEKFILTILATTTAIIPLWTLSLDKAADLDSSNSPSQQKQSEQSNDQDEVNYHSRLNHNAYGVQTAPESQELPIDQIDQIDQADKISSHKDHL